jgi:hypothetical protein
LHALNGTALPNLVRYICQNLVFIPSNFGLGIITNKAKELNNRNHLVDLMNLILESQRIEYILELSKNYEKDAINSSKSL